MTEGPPDRTFNHLAVLYDGDAEFTAATLPFVREGIARDEPVMVLGDPDRCEQIAAALNGASPGAVEFVDAGGLGVNPARLLPAWRDFVDRHAGRPVRGVGEPPGVARNADALVECDRHESLLNLAFSDSGGFSLLCPYDISSLPTEALDRARRTHPSLVENGHPTPSPLYRPPEVSAGPFAGYLRPMPDDAVLTEVTSARDLGRVRSLVTRYARDADLPRSRAGDLALAANELAANSIHHGGGKGMLAIWEDNGAVLCEVRDSGWITEPLTGRLRPPPVALRGRGLWLVNHLCDLVQIRSGATGTTVRVRIERDEDYAAA